jgi:hypothetical protein
MGEGASATIAATQVGPSTYQYAITLDDTAPQPSELSGSGGFRERISWTPSRVASWLPQDGQTPLQMLVRTTGLPFNGLPPRRRRMSCPGVH